ncbi:UDP-glucose--hexose-1-phosphate uridylyltransferase [Aquimarina sediminis]|uniref:UDP-glucose--hexose-1-phosphate uridylyltransferase n=1 Tax=Aquimarina sediminis TaxID=2070536 RepID=UPI0019D468DC|nr:UDP-glucose--hexose-1-phosphate uridylyltransferase [Aquimarina sediminis]
MKDIIRHTHIRKNILTGAQVLVSPHRTKRPWQGKTETITKEEKVGYDKKCYLCPGNSRINKDKNPLYTDTFVFTNDFGALTPDSSSKKYKKGLFEANQERGICKVICFSPNHSLTLSQLPVEAIEKVITTWQSEYENLSEISYINSIQIFENKGEIMGCSNPHPHGQIWAQESIPNEILKKTANFSQHFRKHKNTLLEAYLTQEQQEQERIVYENDHFIVVVPFWAVWPFETMIIPKRGKENIMLMSKGEISSFAKAIQTITSVYDQLFGVQFPYSSGIHQAPVTGKSFMGWHWHMIFYPPLLRSASVKKFMVGYEMFAMAQRDFTAETAAIQLRELVNKQK